MWPSPAGFSKTIMSMPCVIGTLPGALWNLSSVLPIVSRMTEAVNDFPERPKPAKATMKSGRGSWLRMRSASAVIPVATKRTLELCGTLCATTLTRGTGCGSEDQCVALCGRRTLLSRELIESISGSKLLIVCFYCLLLIASSLIQYCFNKLLGVLYTCCPVCFMLVV